MATPAPVQLQLPLTVSGLVFLCICLWCQYILFDVGGVEIHKYKRSKQCRRCRRYSTYFKALNAMYVEDVEDGVCGFYATLHTEYTGPLASPGGKAIYLSLLPCGFSSSPPVSPRMQLC